MQMSVYWFPFATCHRLTGAAMQGTFFALLAKVTLHPCNADTLNEFLSPKISGQVPEAGGGRH